MHVDLNGFAGEVLTGLLTDTSDDVVVRLDQRGFVVQASTNIAALGVECADRLLPPHITDLAEPDHAAEFASQVSGVLAGQPMRGWIEFPLAEGDPTDSKLPSDDDRIMRPRRWHALSLRPLLRPTGEVEGAIGVLRSVQRVRSLEGELYARAVTDPLTGLANRQAFCASLRWCLARGGGQMLAVFAVDGMRALLLRHGQRTADEILWGFAKFLEAMALPGFEIALLDGERFGVVLPGGDEAAAEEWCAEVLMTFAALASPVSARAPRLTVSAGLARVECTVDWTLREAELGLVMARAGGGGEVRRAARRRVSVSASYGLGAERS